MRYFKVLDNGYIAGVQTVSAGGNGNITEAEYNTILSVIHNRPTAPDGYGYRLRDDLTWELYELPPAPDPEDEDISADEIMSELEAIL